MKLISIFIFLTPLLVNFTFAEKSFDSEQYFELFRKLESISNDLWRQHEAINTYYPTWNYDFKNHKPKTRAIKEYLNNLNQFFIDFSKEDYQLTKVLPEKFKKGDLVYQEFLQEPNYIRKSYLDALLALSKEGTAKTISFYLDIILCMPFPERITASSDFHNRVDQFLITNPDKNISDRFQEISNSCETYLSNLGTVSNQIFAKISNLKSSREITEKIDAFNSVTNLLFELKPTYGPSLSWCDPILTNSLAEIKTLYISAHSNDYSKIKDLKDQLAKLSTVFDNLEKKANQDGYWIAGEITETLPVLADNPTIIQVYGGAYQTGGKSLGDRHNKVSITVYNPILKSGYSKLLTVGFDPNQFIYPCKYKSSITGKNSFGNDVLSYVFTTCDESLEQIKLIPIFKKLSTELSELEKSLYFKIEEPKN